MPNLADLLLRLGLDELDDLVGVGRARLELDARVDVLGVLANSTMLSFSGCLTGDGTPVK